MNSSVNASSDNKREGPSIKKLIFLSVMAYAVSLLVTINFTNLEETFWVAWEIKLKDVASAYRDAHTIDVHHTGKPIEVKAKISVTPEMLESINQAPVGVLVSGPFSSNIYWDGVLIGEKGVIGDGIRKAAPGPIDNISFVPNEQLTLGEHEIRLVMSTEHILYDAKRIIHLLALVPYRGDDRRSLRYYAMPLLMLGGLIFLMLQNMRIALGAGSVHHGILSLFAFFVLLNLTTEVSRALINYSYDLHYYRGGMLWISAVLAGASITPLALRVKQTAGVRVIWVLGALAFAVNLFYLGGGGDAKIVEDFMTLSAIPTFVYVLRAFRNGLKPTLSHELLLPLFWVAIFICQRYSNGLFLDVYLFVAVMIFLAGSWYATFTANPLKSGIHIIEEAKETDVQTPLLSFKAIGNKTNHNYEIPLSDIVVIRAADNYTEVLDCNEQTHLYERRLGALMDITPDCFLRVHRSYAVNMHYAMELKSLEGSRYYLILINGVRVPVSRYRAADVREALKS